MGRKTIKTTITLNRTWQHIDVGDKGAYIVIHKNKTTRTKYFESLPYTDIPPANDEEHTIPFPDKKTPESDAYMTDMWAKSATEADTIIDIYALI